VTRDTPRNFSFQSTDWSKIRHAADPASPDHLDAMSALMEGFRPALLAHLVMRRRMPQDQAEDLLHEFIATKILAGKMISSASRTRGRFRTLLLNSLDNFLISWRRKEATLKNSPNCGISLDDETGVSPVILTAERESRYDIEWAEVLFRETLLEMREHCNSTGQQRIWEIFELRLLNPILNQKPTITYEELVERFQFSSPVQAYNSLITGKRMFLRTLRSVVGRYTEGEEAIDLEIQELKEILCKCSAEKTSLGSIGL
jgi:RNA polymerase sigma-70 factor (ECF subfamily)